MDSNFSDKLAMIVSIGVLSSQINDPEVFDFSTLTGFKCDTGIEMTYNLDDKLVRALYSVKINTASKNAIEAKADFSFSYIYKIDNLAELMRFDGKENSLPIMDGVLASNIASISHSTSRGIIYQRLLGTALEKCILSIVNPEDLLRPIKEDTSSSH